MFKNVLQKCCSSIYYLPPYFLRKPFKSLTNFCYYISFGPSFPCGSDGKEPACNAGDLGSIPGLGRSPGEGKGYPLQYSGLENSMDCIVHGVAKSRTQLSDFHFQWAKMNLDVNKTRITNKVQSLFLYSFSSVQFSHSIVSSSFRPHGLQHARPPCPSPTPGASSNSCPLSRCCHPTISFSVVPLSFCLQSFPTSGSFK